MQSSTDLGAALASILAPIVQEAVSKSVAELRQQNEEKPLTRKQIAEWLQVSERQIDLLREKGMPHILCGDSPRFFRAEVTDWMRTRAK